MSAEQVMAVCDVLNRHHVNYVIIGGMAAQLHGVPVERTRDLDVTPSTTASNLDRLASALIELNATLRVPDGPPGGVAFTFDRRSFRSFTTMALVTTHGPLDLSFRPDGTEGYDDLVRASVVIDVGGVSAPVAAVSDVLRSKEAAGREKDLRVLPALIEWIRDQDS